MNKHSVYLATIDPNAHLLAREFGLGLELSEFCTAYNMDEEFAKVEPGVREKRSCSDRFVLHAPFNELFPCAIDPKARDLARSRYRQAIALAQSWGIPKVVIHGGYNPWIYYPVWYTEQSIVFWRDFVKEIPDGMTVCLENVLEEEPAMLLDIIRGVHDPRLKMCLDVGHVNAYSKTPVFTWLESCAGEISHFHIHNNDGSWDTHSPLEEGTIPMAQLLCEAWRLCPDATYTLELPDAASSLRWLLRQKIIE